MPRQRGRPTSFHAPFLREVRYRRPQEASGHPFDLPLLLRNLEIRFERPVTFLVGENGSGKSTLLEAIAVAAGFHIRSGGRNQRYDDGGETPALAAALELAWLPKTASGFFLRAESFFDFAGYLDTLNQSDPRALGPYGGRSLKMQSHGESFLALFRHRVGEGLYLLDEPEAALSPSRQLSLLRILHDLEVAEESQFVVATHSPILLAYPGATILSLDDGRLTRVAYRDTEHYRLTRDFLSDPERYLHHLFAERPDPGEDP